MFLGRWLQHGAIHNKMPKAHIPVFHISELLPDLSLSFFSKLMPVAMLKLLVPFSQIQASWEWVKLRFILLFEKSDIPEPGMFDMKLNL